MGVWGVIIVCLAGLDLRPSTKKVKLKENSIGQLSRESTAMQTSIEPSDSKTVVTEGSKPTTTPERQRKFYEMGRY